MKYEIGNRFFHLSNWTSLSNCQNIAINVNQNFSPRIWLFFAIRKKNHWNTFLLSRLSSNVSHLPSAKSRATLSQKKNFHQCYLRLHSRRMESQKSNGKIKLKLSYLPSDPNKPQRLVSYMIWSLNHRIFRVNYGKMPGFGNVLSLTLFWKKKKKSWKQRFL